MKETGILFTPDNIRAIMEGRKTQTRRVLKNAEFHGCLTGDCPHGTQAECDVCLAEWAKQECPQGGPGDRLYIKEAWALAGARLIDPCLNYKVDGVQRPINRHKDGHDLWYPYGSTKPITSEELMKPDLHTLVWRNAMFMPKWAARTWLDIIDVRVQRVKSISNEDARAEGIPQTWGEFGFAPPQWASESIGAKHGSPGSHLYDNRSSAENYGFLWDSINAKTYPWSSNPWVWAITFRKAA